MNEGVFEFAIVCVCVCFYVCVRYLVERKDYAVRIDNTGNQPGPRLTFKCKHE